MARGRKSKTKGKQYTTREIILLIALAFVGIIYLYFTYFYTPMLEESQQLKTDTETFRIEYTARKGLIAKKDTMQEELKSYEKDLEQFQSQYFKTSHQEHFIKVLEVELLDEENLNVSSLSFTGANPSAEFVNIETGAMPLESSVVSFPFTGTYETLEELIRRLEGYPQIIRINALDITYMTDRPEEEEAFAAEPLYQGNIQIEFFTVLQEYRFPWKSELPPYEDAESYTQGLFQYDDDASGIPPFLVEQEVAEENPEEEPVVVVPEEEEEEPEESEEEPEDEEEPDDEEEPIDEEKPENSEEDQTFTYKVKPQDTLFSISMRFYGTQHRVTEIMALNNIKDPRFLQSGRIILLPSI